MAIWRSVIAVAVTVGLLSTTSQASTTAPFRCPVTTPTPGHPRPYFNAGTNRIAVALPPRATFVAVPEGKAGGAWVLADGWIRTKVGWWAAAGGPRVTGRRLDRSARPLRANVGPLSHAVPGGPFYPSSLYFSGPGCWRLTATVGSARLAVVVRVVVQR